ncbi:inositol monophosphatase family protein [Alcaligenes endophyticus]|uniref:Inositol-1-monophosphatase n=1 Tax=Alcaligenes endophyticus TaxID=1929088 RepID=A0ABT8EN83_9BURK|nr:inositol monophosphatase family protein [Alcaligenes endophyticus]MCX5591564.1 inositol monophosphatase family protein [Alcaligenes endophyticus]MDN4122555.1 inositol monophosphatase [Alcaligenes endophyticus]
MPLSRMPLSAYLEAAVTAAHAAASILQGYASKRGELVIDTKMRNDLVSQADREAENACINLLQERCPEIGIIAEESGGQRKELGNWVIDPLDGTTNFLHGIPHYAVSIALVAPAGTQMDHTTLADDTPIIGVVYDPCRNELFTAVYGVGAWLNGVRIQCSASTTLQDSLLATGLPFRDFSFSAQYMPGLEQALLQTRGIRRMGAAALDLAWVACGRYDGYWEMGLAPWDVAAGTLLVREAQGLCEDLYQREAWPSGGYLYAANRAIAPQLHAMLKPYLTTKPTTTVTP